MKQIIAIGLAAVAIAAAGCSKAEMGVQGSERYIQATASIETAASIEAAPQGRAPIMGTDVAIDDVVFLRTDHNKTDLTEIDFSITSPTILVNSKRNIGGIVDFGAKGSAEIKQAYDITDDKTAYFFGYRPQGTSTTPLAEIKWTLDGKTDVMTTNLWNAGHYSAPKFDGMVFDHQVARLEVICQAEKDATLEVVQTAWGKIKSISIKSIYPEMTLSLSNRTISSSGELVDFLLLKGDYSGAFEPTEIPIHNNETITAAAMLNQMADVVAVTLSVTTELFSDKPVLVTLTDTFSAGKTHKIILTFNALEHKITALGTTIDEWKQGGSGASDVTKEPL